MDLLMCAFVLGFITSLVVITVTAVVVCSVCYIVNMTGYHDDCR